MFQYCDDEKLDDLKEKLFEEDYTDYFCDIEFTFDDTMGFIYDNK